MNNKVTWQNHDTILPYVFISETRTLNSIVAIEEDGGIAIYASHQPIDEVPVIKSLERKIEITESEMRRYLSMNDYGEHWNKMDSVIEEIFGEK